MTATAEHRGYLPAPAELNTLEDESLRGLVGIALASLQRLVQLPEHIKLPELRSLWRRAPRRWDSTNYFDPRLELSPEQRWINTSLDLLTYFDEYVGMLKVKLYEYGPNGIIRNGQSYSHSVVEVCRNNERLFATEGRDATRAHLETRNAELNDPYLRHPELLNDQAIVVFSPKGSTAEKYPGQRDNNYSFINVYYFYGGRMNFKQFTNFDSVPNLQTLHNQLITQLGAQPATPQPATHLKEPSHQLIATPLKIPVDKLANLEQLVFANSQDWKIKLIDLPDLNAAEFETAKVEVLGALQTIFTELLTSELPKAAAHQFDHLIDDITRRHFLKWVEANARNYRELLANQKLGWRQKLRDQLRHHPELADLSLVERITTEFKLEMAKRKGLATREDRELLKQLQHVSELNPALPLNRLASLLHCTVGTPTSVLKEAAKAGKGVEGLLPAGESIRTTYLPLVLINDVTGEKVTWYVHKDHYDEYAATSRYVNGVALGPCDIDLNQDDFVLSAEKYEELVAIEDQQRRQQHLQDSLASNPAVTDVADHTAQLARVEELLTKTLYKESTSLSEFMAGSVFKSPYQLPEQWLEVGRRLASALDPIKELELIIEELEKILLESDVPQLELSEQNSPIPHAVIVNLAIPTAPAPIQFGVPAPLKLAA